MPRRDTTESVIDDDPDPTIVFYAVPPAPPGPSELELAELAHESVLILAHPRLIPRKPKVLPRGTRPMTRVSSGHVADEDTTHRGIRSRR